MSQLELPCLYTGTVHNYVIITVLTINLKFGSVKPNIILPHWAEDFTIIITRIWTRIYECNCEPVKLRFRIKALLPLARRLLPSSQWQQSFHLKPELRVHLSAWEHSSKTGSGSNKIELWIKPDWTVQYKSPTDWILHLARCLIWGIIVAWFNNIGTGKNHMTLEAIKLGIITSKFIFINNLANSSKILPYFVSQQMLYYST